MVGLRSGGTSPLFSFHEGCPAPGLGAWGLGVACSACDPAPTAAAELGKITCLNAKKKLCANGGGDRKTGPIRPER